MRLVEEVVKEVRSLFAEEPLSALLMTGSSTGMVHGVRSLGSAALDMAYVA